MNRTVPDPSLGFGRNSWQYLYLSSYDLHKVYGTRYRAFKLETGRLMSMQSLKRMTEKKQKITDPSVCGKVLEVIYRP